MPVNQTLPNVIELPGNQLAEVNEAAKLIHDAKVIGECYRVRVLFDTEHLKNDKDYIAIIEDTWLRTFKDIDPELLETAVQEFIVSDKKLEGIKPVWGVPQRRRRIFLVANYGEQCPGQILFIEEGLPGDNPQSEYQG